MSPSIPFMLDLTITRVSRSSPSIFARRLMRTAGLTNMIPLGETEEKRRRQVEAGQTGKRETHS